MQFIMKAISASDEEKSKSIRENVCKEIAKKMFPWNEAKKESGKQNRISGKFDSIYSTLEYTLIKTLKLNIKENYSSIWQKTKHFLKEKASSWHQNTPQ